VFKEATSSERKAGGGDDTEGAEEEIDFVSPGIALHETRGPSSDSKMIKMITSCGAIITKDVTSGGGDFRRTDADRCERMEASVECIGSGIH